MPDSLHPEPSQSAVSHVNAQTITVGNITQTIIYQQRPKALSIFNRLHFAKEKLPR
jgi:hypothetical protein